MVVKALQEKCKDLQVQASSSVTFGRTPVFRSMRNLVFNVTKSLKCFCMLHMEIELPVPPEASFCHNLGN